MHDQGTAAAEADGRHTADAQRVSGGNSISFLAASVMLPDRDG